MNTQEKAFHILSWLRYYPDNNLYEVEENRTDVIRIIFDWRSSIDIKVGIENTGLIIHSGTYDTINAKDFRRSFNRQEKMLKTAEDLEYFIKTSGF